MVNNGGERWGTVENGGERRRTDGERMENGWERMGTEGRFLRSFPFVSVRSRFFVDTKNAEMFSFPQILNDAAIQFCEIA